LSVEELTEGKPTNWEGDVQRNRDKKRDCNTLMNLETTKRADTPTASRQQGGKGSGKNQRKNNFGHHQEEETVN